MVIYLKQFTQVRKVVKVFGFISWIHDAFGNFYLMVMIYIHFTGFGLMVMIVFNLRIIVKGQRIRKSLVLSFRDPFHLGYFKGASLTRPFVTRHFIRLGLIQHFKKSPDYFNLLNLKIKMVKMFFNFK